MSSDSTTPTSTGQKIFMVGFLGYYSDSDTRIVVAASAEQALALYKPFVERSLPDLDQMDEESPTKYEFTCHDGHYDSTFYIEEIGTGAVSDVISITTG
jgi:hypothetical protein